MVVCNLLQVSSVVSFADALGSQENPFSRLSSLHWVYASTDIRNGAEYAAQVLFIVVVYSSDSVNVF